jgi:hypothetical protein
MPEHQNIKYKFSWQDDCLNEISNKIKNLMKVIAEVNLLQIAEKKLVSCWLSNRTIEGM